ncbi:MAG TPA: hypothetical protein VHX43_07870 [Xanthobacteraceae bacterium]|jgi:hypothetical protein|nr:hypothetical protein [Xanthobacteraceae bacterium]
MPKYYFILQWADRRHDDPHGTALPDDRAARSYAERIIHELKDAGGYEDSGLTMVVADAARQTVFSIPFA